MQANVSQVPAIAASVVEYVNASTLPTGLIVKNVYHFITMLHGDEPHQRMYMSANVSKNLGITHKLRTFYGKEEETICFMINH